MHMYIVFILKKKQNVLWTFLKVGFEILETDAKYTQPGCMNRKVVK